METVDVTDEQLRDLLSETRRQVDALLRKDPTPTDDFAKWRLLEYHCEVALGRRRARKGGSRSKSRARCAEVYKARQKASEPDECATCLGARRIRDGETGHLRKCLDCNGTGHVLVTPNARAGKE